MISPEEITTIKSSVEEFLQKMTVTDFTLQITLSDIIDIDQEFQEKKVSQPTVTADTLQLDMRLGEPQFFIGKNGQTLFELQRLLRILLNKKLQKNFYVSLDINDYKKNKIIYLQKIAQDAAAEVLVIKTPKTLPPMSSYERRVVHAELAKRTDIATESQGEGEGRHIVISLK